MSNTPKTIQIFLLDGDPHGIRIAEITTRIVQVIEVPRSLLQIFLAMPECEQVALYFLFGASETDTPKVYIGQSGDMRTRLVRHNKEKEFWERALVLISKTHSLTQTHALFLEWHCIQAARKAGRYADENGNNGSKPYTPAPLAADCLEIFATAQTLLATLGYPLFDALAKPISETPAEQLFYCKASGTNASGLYTAEGFVVLKNSTGRLENVPSLAGTSNERLRQRLLETGVTRIEGDSIVFCHDHLFRSPSMAAVALAGRNCNGWTEWKTQDGKTLDEVKRQAV